MPVLKRCKNMDKLFKTNKNMSGQFQFDKKTANVFDDMLHRSVPFYAETQKMIVELAKTFVQNKSNVYDLGCSTGNTLSGLAKSIKSKNIKFIGMDYSDAMLKKARAGLKKNKLLKRCSLVKSDLNKSFEIKNASVIIMNLTLQFVRPVYRDTVISKIHKGLKKDGCFILIEKILSPSPVLNKAFIKLYYDYKKRMGYSKLEISKKREALENVLVPYRYNENIELLKRNGFKTIDEFFRWYNFSGIIAIKDK